MYCNKSNEKEGRNLYYNISDIEYFDQIKKESIKKEKVEVIDSDCIGYRLPTIKEWRYAYYGGKDGENTFYSGSDVLEEIAWTANNSSQTNVTNSDENGLGTLPVGLKKKNELGIYDMSGNVSEFSFDSFFDKDLEQYFNLGYGSNYNDSPNSGGYISRYSGVLESDCFNYVGLRIARNAIQ